MNKIKANVLVKVGDHIDTDVINSGRFMTGDAGPADWARNCMRDIDPEIPQKMASGGIMVAGVNFGCGSSRESAPTAIKLINTKAVIAEEFARIFYRNGINIGLVCIECKGISTMAKVGDELEVDTQTGEVRNLTTGEVLYGTTIPDELRPIFDAGGLVPYLKQQKENR